jgi:hypothetical protein
MKALSKQRATARVRRLAGVAKVDQVRGRDASRPVAEEVSLEK